MNLQRLRELAKAGKDGSIRPEELKELFEALPSVLDPEDADVDQEALRFFDSTRGIRRAMSPKEFALHAYHCGTRREYR